jgi:hypothetical protein
LNSRAPPVHHRLYVTPINGAYGRFQNGDLPIYVRWNPWSYSFKHTTTTKLSAQTCTSGTMMFVSDAGLLVAHPVATADSTEILLSAQPPARSKSASRSSYGMVIYLPRSILLLPLISYISRIVLRIFTPKASTLLTTFREASNLSTG